MVRFAVAIDGPSAAGKSSVSSFLAMKLNVLHLNTGALYRALALFCIDNKVNYNDSVVLKNALENCKVEAELSNNKQLTKLNGVGVDDSLYSPEVSNYVVHIAKYDFVRKSILDLQRSIAKDNSVVMEGRDIASVVLKDAKHKYYLDANVEMRAKRRYNDYIKQNKDIQYSDVLADIKNRDKNDSDRADSPLFIAKDAIVINTDNMSVLDVVEMIYQDIIKKGI